MTYNEHLRCTRNMIEVTSLYRPDERWTRTDVAGHVHQWFQNGKPLSEQIWDPSADYRVPSVVWVRDPDEYDSDGEPYTVGHFECKECHERIELGYRADTEQRFIAGLARFEDVHVWLEDAETEPLIALMFSNEPFVTTIDGHRVRCYVINIKRGEQQKNHVVLRPIEIVK